MELAKLIPKEGVKKVYGDCQADIKSLAIDSKAVLPGALFICIKGENHDGHDYYREALFNGAAALVVERQINTDACQIVVSDSRRAMTEIAEIFYDFPSKKLKMIGVTGTNGKTTVCYMIKSILQEAKKNVGIIGTLGTYYNCCEIAPELTTPDPICLNKTLADMVKCGVEYVVMEVSAHAAHYEKTGSTCFEYMVFTNLSHDHLDFFKTMDSYKRAKQSLFAIEKVKRAIYNLDDQTGREFAQISTVPYLSYALENPSDCFAVNIVQYISGSSFMMNISDEICQIYIKTIGLFNVSNALAAATVCRALGIDIQTIANGLKNLKSVSGRLEYAATHNAGDIFIDFAHTPMGISSVLGALRALKPTKLICVFGCGGNRDKEKRAVMGKTVGQLADFSIITSDNPRYEEPLDIISEIEKGMRNVTKDYVAIQDRKAAINYALKKIESGNILVIAGKGAECYQEIMGIKHIYSDKAVIEEVIKSLEKNV